MKCRVHYLYYIITQQRAHNARLLINNAKLMFTNLTVLRAIGTL